MDTSSGMPLGILSAIRQEASHSVKNGDHDELLFAVRRVLDQVKESIPALHKEIIEELRKNPKNTFRVIAEHHGESITATHNAAYLKSAKKTQMTPVEQAYTMTAAAHALHTYPEIVRDRVNKNPGADWFVVKLEPGQKRPKTLITDLARLKELLPAGGEGRYSITEAANALEVQRSVVVACVDRNVDRPWVVREVLPGKQRADKWVSGLGELRKALAQGPRGFTPAQAAENAGLALSDIRAFIKRNPQSPNLERSKPEGARLSITRIIDLDRLKRDLTAGPASK
jgi:hypothetical protein